MEALAQDVPQDQRLAGLQRELADLREEKRCLTREQDELREGSAQLKRSLEAAEGRGRELDTECQRWAGLHALGDKCFPCLFIIIAFRQFYLLAYTS